MRASDFDPGLRAVAGADETEPVSDPGGARRPRSRRELRQAVVAAVVLIGLLAIAATGLGGSDDEDTAPDASTPADGSVPFDEWVTFPEGLTLAQMGERLAERRPGIDAPSFVAAANAAQVDERFARPAGTVSGEGLLFPDTYPVEVDATAAEVVGMMTGLMEQVAIDDEDIVDGAERLGVTPYEVLIIASLIEEEAKTAIDRPKIARVIYNRLEIGMELQIDASLFYDQDRERPFSELRQNDTPYNTYTRTGLPPTPISNPGRASIEAALAPADDPPTDDPICVEAAAAGEPCRLLFYVLADSEGNHTFSATYDQHLANVERSRAAGLL